MGDEESELTAYFDRQFARIERSHAEALAKMNAATDSTRTDLSRAVSASLDAIPDRIESAFGAGIANVSDANRQAHEAAQTIGEAGDRLRRITRSQMLGQAYTAAIWFTGMVLAGFLLAGAYYLAKTPKYQDRWLLCTAAWSEKTQTCKGKIYTVPENYEANNRQ